VSDDGHFVSAAGQRVAKVGQIVSAIIAIVGAGTNSFVDCIWPTTLPWLWA